MAYQRPPPTCKVCSAPLDWIGTGRPPIYCGQHGKKGNARSQAAAPGPLRPLAGDEGHDRDRELKIEQKRSATAVHAAGARLLAVALRHDPRPARAARFARLPEDMDPEEFELLVEEAQSDAHKALRSGSRVATAASIGVGMALAVELLVAKIGELPPSQLPLAIKALAQAQDYLGGGQLVYSSVELRFRPPASFTEFEAEMDRAAPQQGGTA